jgi:hypothetical protein
MVSSSFRSRCRHRVYPRPGGQKRLLTAAGIGAAVVAAAGCGGGGDSRQSASREVSARGYRFSIPGTWKVTRTPTTVAAAPFEGADELVSVSVFHLLRSYSPALWNRVVPELDRAADELGRQLTGSVASARTVTVAGDRARAYELTFKREGRDVRERITFVLRDRREYELLCRWRAADAEPEACRQLVSSFSVA